MATRAGASLSLARTPLASMGVVLTTLCGVLFVVLFLFDSLGWFANPYLGLLLFVALPLGFIAGLILIPVGNYLQTRHGVEFVWPLVNLNESRHRAVALIVLVATALNVVIVTMATSGALHYMETVSFCGQVCHSVMEPQFVAYRHAPHSQVPCVSCHVGSGAQALVESKLNGTRQLFALMTGRYSRPIPSPVGAMRTAQDTCATCHFADLPYGDKLVTVREYADDEANSETVTTLTMHLAPQPAADDDSSPPRRGIHWHARSDTAIDYVTTDAQHQEIPLVVLHNADGTTTEFRAEGASDAGIRAGVRHRMDCMDCHNRPSHTFAGSAGHAVDAAFAAGQVPREVPFARREMVAALGDEYDSRDAALSGIAARLRRQLGAGSTGGELDRHVDRIVRTTQDLYAKNVFPSMRVTWGTYPNELGHSAAPGCFRCHDDNHRSADGQVIRQDCELCHSISFGSS